MGQSESFNSLPSAVESIQDSIIRQAKNLSEISSLTYEQFLDHLQELNSLSQQCMDADGKQLVFVVKRGSDSSLLWKGTIRVACLKYDARVKRMECCRLLNLGQFLKVFKTLKNELEAAQQIDTCQEADCLDATSCSRKITLNIDKEIAPELVTECCICLERKQEITLPCAHSYCQTCIDQWNVNNNTCPVCREVMVNRNEEWILSDAPNSAEISELIATSLMDIAAD